VSRLRFTSGVIALGAIGFALVSAAPPSPTELAENYRQARKQTVSTGADQVIPALPLSQADALAKQADSLVTARPADSIRLFRDALWRLPKLPAGSPKGLARILGDPTLHHPASVNCIALDPANGRMACGCGWSDWSKGVSTVGHSVRVWNTSNGTLEFEYFGHAEPVRGIAILSDGRIASTAGKEIHIWKPGEAAKVLNSTGGSISSIAANSNGNKFVTGGDDRTVRLWDLNDDKGSRSLQVQTAAITGVAMSEKLVASVNGEGTLMVWDHSGATPRKILEQKPFNGNSPLNAVQFSPDHKNVAVCSERAIRLIEIPSGRESSEIPNGVKRTFEGPRGHSDRPGDRRQ
jgi:WD40 repeat protein